MKKKTYALLIIPCVILITVVLVFPLISIIYPSFFDGVFTFEHYSSFLSDPFYQKILWRTVKLSLITTLICVVLGVPTAYYISTQRKSIRGILTILIMFPLLTNAIIRGFAWMTILGSNGIINSLLKSLSIIDKPLSLLYSEFAIVIGSVYLFLPVMVTTLTSVMDSIDGYIVYATQSLGAKPWQVFMKAIVPLSFSGIIIGSVLVFTGTMSAYTTPSLLGGNKNMMLATLLYQQANQLSNWTQAGMISLIMIILSYGVMKIMNGINLRLDKRGYEHE